MWLNFGLLSAEKTYQTYAMLMEKRDNYSKIIFFSSIDITITNYFRQDAEREKTTGKSPRKNVHHSNWFLSIQHYA